MPSNADASVHPYIPRPPPLPPEPPPPPHAPSHPGKSPYPPGMPRPALQPPPPKSPYTLYAVIMCTAIQKLAEGRLGHGCGICTMLQMLSGLHFDAEDKRRARKEQVKVMYQVAAEEAQRRTDEAAVRYSSALRPSPGAPMPCPPPTPSPYWGVPLAHYVLHLCLSVVLQGCPPCGM